MRAKLTSLTRQAAHALADGDYLLFDGQDGLLLIAGSGDPRTRAYSWYWRHRDVNGKIRKLKLGRWPALSLADASAERERLDRERKRGVDHAAVKQAEKQQARQAALVDQIKAYSLHDLATDYLALLAKTRRPKAVKDAEYVLAPVMIDDPAIEWTRSRCVTLLRERAADAPSMARVLRQEMARAWDIAVGEGKLPETLPNPWDACRRDGALQALTKQKRRRRFLDDAELATWLAWLPKSKLSRDVSQALELTLRLGARSGEVIAMRWEDVDLKRGTWTLKETKTDATRTIRLPAQVIAVLEARPRGRWVFPSPTTGKSIRQSAIGWQVAKQAKSSGLESWSAHDLRRSCRTGLSRIGCPSEVAEAAIGHSKAGIQGVYDLHAYESEVGAWLAKWNDHLDALASPAVVQLRKRA